MAKLLMRDGKSYCTHIPLQRAVDACELDNASPVKAQSELVQTELPPQADIGIMIACCA